MSRPDPARTRPVWIDETPVAPPVRRVDMLSGDVAPTKYFAALSEADKLCAELDGLRELQTRIQELEAENEQAVEDWGANDEMMLADNAHLTTRVQELSEERDELDQRCNGLAEYIGDVEDQRDTALMHVQATKAARDGLTADAVKAATRQQRLLEESGELIDRLRAERDDLAERLDSLKEASGITLGLLADARRDLRTAVAERDSARAERDTYRMAVSK
jgi:uncharacterized coiled-coil DUF342 family protein